MDRRSLFASLVSLALLAPIGCAATSAEEGADEESVGEAEGEITAAAQSLVGKYYAHAPTFGGFARLTLSSNGKYSAQVDPAGTALCVTSPCLLPESGTWNASKVNGKVRLRLRASGETSRFYDAAKSGEKLTLTQPGKPTQNLLALGANACIDDGDCKTTEECGPKLCLMWCAVNDPSCCGPSTCQPKNPPPPPPPPSCWGAWKDQNGVCRTPSDGVYPASCCAGPTCGNAQCAAGQVCCNPLAGICTAPGEVCAQ
jgi:hypothetical protein